MTDAIVMTRTVQVLAAAHEAMGVLRLGAGAGADDIRRIEAAIGCALPQAANTAAGARPRALWTAPREWTLIDLTASQREGLEAACAGLLSHYADVTDGRVGLRVTGPDAAQLIAAECPLDLSRGAFADNCCAQSVFAGVPILVDRRAGEDGFRLYVDVSLADHLAAWLKAALEP